MRIIRHALLTTAALMALTAAAAACAGNDYAPTSVDRGAGYATAIAHWKIQSSSKAQQGGAEISG
ncbi:MAG: hypothetical protein JSS21_06030, partial [Proteobacteria bacterium]|nr:hypothetical protein [Pseudomonadota bacterium]